MPVKSIYHTAHYNAVNKSIIMRSNGEDFLKE